MLGTHSAYPAKATPEPLMAISGAAFAAGLVTAPFTAVTITMKIQQQVHHVSTLDVIRQLPKLRPFQYFPLHLFQESMGRCLYLTTYFGTKRLLDTLEFDSSELGCRVAAGATSGVVAWAVFYPLDVVRSRLFGGIEKERGALELLPLLYKEGVLYKGLSFTLIRAAPVAGIVLTSYDLILDWIREYDNDA
jgi:hypothetical protein